MVDRFIAWGHRSFSVLSLVQRLAHRCWDLLAGSSSSHQTLTSLFVERTLERVVLEDDPAYTQLWMSLTTVQKKALKALTDRGIIRVEQALGDVRLRLDDPFFATWLRIARLA